MPSSRKTLPEISDSVSSRVSRALRKAASARLSAFTLAELIVVVAILAVLATIGFLALSGYRQDAKDAVIKANVRSVYSAIAAESTALQKSARCFIKHSPTHTLTGGAVVMFDGGVADALVWGDCGTPGTNYSAGNPDYAALKLDPAKFRISLLSSPRLAATAMEWPGASAAEEYVADPSLLLVGAADLTDESGSKPRVRAFVQVAAVLSSETSYVAGDFPSSDVDDGAVAGLIKDAAYAGSSTGALVDGASTGSPAPCPAGEVSGYSVPALSSGERQEVRKAVANGEGVATARCSYGTVRIEDETAQCDADYVPADPVPSCVRDNCGGTFPADAVSNELTPGGTGNWTYGETAGTCRFKCAENFTWSDGACKADCTVTAASPSYLGLSYGLAANLPIAHGATAVGTGTHVFGTDPSNGELQASFSYSCDEGVATATPTEIGGSCQTNFTWNGDFASPICSPNSKTATCQWLPANAAWNTVPSITQTWNGSSWMPSETGSLNAEPSTTECRFKCQDGYSGGDCSSVGIVGDNVVGRKWADNSIATNCKAYRNPTAPKAYVGNTGDGIYWIDPDGAGGAAAYLAYCEMTTDGGGWTLIMMSRESLGFWNSTVNASVSSQPNYDSWSYSSRNASTINPTTNASTNVVTAAASTVPFQDLYFRCAGNSTYCGSDNHSIYRHSTTSLFSAKTGNLTQITSTWWPFSAHRVYTTSGTSNSAYWVPINTISLSAQCAPASSRPYNACIRIGVVGRDYYDFQNAVGFGIKGSQWYSESHSVNAMLGYISHRSFSVLPGDVYVR